MMERKTKRVIILGAVLGAVDGYVIHWSHGMLSNTFGGTLLSNMLVAAGIGIVVGYLALKWVES